MSDLLDNLEENNFFTDGPEKEYEKILLDANEYLLKSKGFLLFNIDDNNNESNFIFDCRKLSSVEFIGFLHSTLNIINCKLEEMYNLQNGVEDEEDDLD